MLFFVAVSCLQSQSCHRVCRADQPALGYDLLMLAVGNLTELLLAAWLCQHSLDIHLTVQAQPADFILKQRPAAVMFENSFSAEGGNGAVVICADKSTLDGSELVTMACATATHLQQSPPYIFERVWQVWIVAEQLVQSNYYKHICSHVDCSLR